MSDIISSSLSSFFSRVKRGFEKVFLNLIEDDAVSSIESNTNITNDYHLNNSNINESRMGLSILYNKNMSNNMSYLSNQHLAYVSKNDKKSEASKISKRTKNTLNSYYKNERNLRKEGIIQEVKSLNSGSISSLDNFHMSNRNVSKRNDNEADEKDEKNLSLLGKKRNTLIDNSSNKKNTKIITDEMKLNNNNNPISSISSASFSNLDNKSNMSYLNINNKSTTTTTSMTTSKINNIKSKNYDQLRRELELKREKNKKYFEDLKENSRKSIIEEIREKQIINDKFKKMTQKEYHINYFLKDLLKVESVNHHSFHSKPNNSSALAFKSGDENEKNKKESLFGNDNYKKESVFGNDNNKKDDILNISSKNELFIEGFDNEKKEKKIDTTIEKEKETEKPKPLFSIPQQPFELKSGKEEKKEDSIFLNVNKTNESNDKPKLYDFGNFSNKNTSFTSVQTPNSIFSKESPFGTFEKTNQNDSSFLNNKIIEKKEEASTISSVLTLENRSIFQNLKKEDNKENIHDKGKKEEKEEEEIKEKPSIFAFLAPNVKFENKPISFGNNENTEKKIDFSTSNFLITENKEIVNKIKNTEEKNNELPINNHLETSKNKLFPSNLQENNQNNEKEITKVTILNEEHKTVHEKKEDNKIIESPNTSHDTNKNNPFNSSSYSLVKGLDTSKSLLNNSENPFSQFTQNNISNLPNDSNNLKNNNPFYGSGNKKNLNSYENSLSFSNNSNSNNSLSENIPNNKSLFPSFSNKPFENSNLNLNNTSTFNTNTNSIFNNNVLSNNNQLNNTIPSNVSSIFNNPTSSSSLFPSVNTNPQSLFPSHTNNPSSSGFNNNQNSIFSNIQPLSSGILSGNPTNTPTFQSLFPNSNSILPVNNGMGVGLSSGASFKIGK